MKQYFFLKLQSISISVISNRNSFRGLSDKIASVYILVEKYVNILAMKTASPGNRHCADCSEIKYLHTRRSIATATDHVASGHF